MTCLQVNKQTSYVLSWRVYKLTNKRVMRSVDVLTSWQADKLCAQLTCLQVDKQTGYTLGWRAYKLINKRIIRSVDVFTNWQTNGLYTWLTYLQVDKQASYVLSWRVYKLTNRPFKCDKPVVWILNFWLLRMDKYPITPFSPPFYIPNTHHSVSRQTHPLLSYPTVSSHIPSFGGAWGGRFSLVCTFCFCKVLSLSFPHLRPFAF